MTTEFNKFLKYQSALDKGWIHVSFVEKVENQKYWNEPNTQIEESFDREEVTDWCKERCKKGWVVAGGSVLFEDDKDAMLFKFRFSKFK